MWMWMWAFTCASILLPSVVLYWSFGFRGGGSLNSRFLALECKHSNVQAFSYLRLSSGDGDALNPRLRACECECELHMCIVSLVSIITFGCLLMMVRFLWWWFPKPSFVCMHMLMLMWALPCTLCCSKHFHLLCCRDSSVPVVVVLLTLGCVHANVSIHMCFVAVAKHFLTFGCFVMMVRFWLWWCAQSSIAWMWIWEFTCASILLSLVDLWRWFGVRGGGSLHPHMWMWAVTCALFLWEAFSHLQLSCDDALVSVVVVLLTLNCACECMWAFTCALLENLSSIVLLTPIFMCVSLGSPVWLGNALNLELHCSLWHKLVMWKAQPHDMTT